MEIKIKPSDDGGFYWYVFVEDDGIECPYSMLHGYENTLEDVFKKIKTLTIIKKYDIINI